MQTLTKPGVKTTDRLQQTVAAVARLLDQTMNDVQALDSEVQERVLRAVQDAEATFEQQAADRLKFAVEEAELNTRILVTEEVQGKMKDQLAANVDAARQEFIADRAQLQQEMERLKRAVAELQNERSQLIADCQRANQLLDESTEQHSRALAETDEAAAIALEMQITTAVERERVAAKAKWDAERAQIVAERDRALQAVADRNAEHEQSMSLTERFRAEITEERDRLRRALEETATASVELESECDRLREEYEHARKLLAEATSEKPRGGGSGIDLDALRAEVSRVDGLIQDISNVIEDPATELSVVIRKNAERAELESYLRGIRFSLPA